MPFFIAFKVPNLFRRLFVEGAFAHAFVPVLADYQATGDKIQVQSFMANSAGALMLLMTLVSLLGVVIAPLLIWVLAPGFAIHEELRELTAVLLQWCMPYLLFVTLVAWAGSVLNAHGHFAMPAFTPALLNIVMIMTMLAVMPSSSQPVTLLAASVSVAGLLQLIVQLPLLSRLNLLPKLSFDFKHPGVRRFFSLLLPTIFSVSVTQINLLLDTLVASLLSPGSVSWLYYSDRLVEFPLAVLGMALAAVILPNLAKHHAA
ncbi:lipid II flippase MurJ, partial [Methylocucumis oryzae]|uniref:lipid II flippase MurJ n=1 Tax=Methylocucumis oryzae TaxID=1632867 RepID=UPI000AFBC2F5